jgi:hypothetical protein
MRLPLAEYLKLPRWQGMTSEGMDRLVTMFRHYDQYGFRCGNNRVLSMLLGRPTTTYEQFLHRSLDQSKQEGNELLQIQEEGRESG